MLAVFVPFWQISFTKCNSVPLQAILNGENANMTPESAQTIALQALAWIASEEKFLQALLDRTGASGDDLRASAADPDFLGAVIDFLLENEEILTDFCEFSNLKPELPIQARHALPGATPEW